MREINRIIVAAIIFSKDEKVLMGKKDPGSGGVYIDSWHIPGGGVEEGETLDQALVREVREEVGIDISPYKIKKRATIGHGSSEKTLSNGERVICHMEFNHFEVLLDEVSTDIKLELADDLVEARWFSRTELKQVQQIPGGKELFREMGYLD